MVNHEVQRAMEIDANPKFTTKLTDVECIEYIFGFIDLIDLLNVADSNKYMSRVAEPIFSRKYGKNVISLTSVRMCSERFFNVSTDCKLNFFRFHHKNPLLIVRHRKLLHTFCLTLMNILRII